MFDTGKNIPESNKTLLYQQQRLIDGKRYVQMFPIGTVELPLPSGMERICNERGCFHYNPYKINAIQVLLMSNRGRENEFLELGKFSKSEIVERICLGENLIVIGEYTPEMIEVRAAIGTPSTIQIQKSFFDRTKDADNLIMLGLPPRVTHA